ncbi:ABC-F family ATP-binding cassette domain-containing protein [Mesobacterium pallidum]|uniref:ABC-F family ATP-binding cassette domain-containing protein n=1 Tax=Mesobacterium pallidum TaxID=2872037 RepID=UPI001EE2C4AE|nr:ABC-F family ATP-binding cassette domain-containing protein [Mesobacterium pallidum]
MPVSVSLTNLTWSPPDRPPLFTDLTLAFGPERTGLVGRNGTGKSTLLHLVSGALAPAAGQVQVRGSCALLRQEVIDRPGDTIADLFGVTAALALLDRAAAGAADARVLAEADWTLPARIEAALARCGLVADPGTPLAQLSGGQRVRAALASMFLAAPDVLLLDEPTNNLDADGRQAVAEILAGWRGAVIVASHDRALLEQVDAIVELTGLGATRYGGPYSAYRALKDTELAAAEQHLAHAEKTRDDAAARARQAAERKSRKDAAGRRSRGTGSQGKMLLDKRRERAEGTLGAGTRLREARAEAADAALRDARDRVEVLQPIQMEIAPTGLPAGRTVLQLDGVTGGHDPAQPVIRDLSLTLTGPERLALAGPNGSGKSTLLALVSGALTPTKGSVSCHVPMATLDQHVTLLHSEETLHAAFLRRVPGSDANTAHAALARFGFRAHDAQRRVADLSGGERLRAGLACTLGTVPPPGLLILDEPTNHLDLDSLAELEGALQAYDGALIVVSHDPDFLEAIGITRTLRLGG